ncbi:hypothetical protein C1752_00248 [Acaryochloris thomasi RCC1774]|uniref:Uncharacterized protein n=1 Tax=Acaryochloris thomasi RCC1774 TaxID=1764569 RepID=A0A2W1K1M7_9CYAN|nr:DUF11 domain-containing protein [Acaryochloris thomasi]PZD75344.1 hypothetical protein C1752_00248 [Acaryochloris thomasi RCC1774]
MKRRLSMGLGILAVAIAVPFASSTPVLANLQEAGEALVQQILQPQVKLALSAEKQVITTDAEGNKATAWEAIEGDVTVQPGDVLRYTLNSENAGDKPASNLVVTQPIPQKTAFRADSAKANGAELTYSIDAGQTFSAQPLIEETQPDGSVKMVPAPAEMYTHVQWDYSNSLQPMTTVRATYEVAVK